MDILVIGGTGPSGPLIVNGLVERGHSVTILHTGRHEFKNGVTHTILERERLTLKATTLPQVLKTAGYTTGIFGKWHLGDEPDHWPDKRGYDEMFIHGCGGIGQSYPGSCGDVPGNSYFDPTILHNGTFEKTKGDWKKIYQLASFIREKHYRTEIQNHV